MRPLEPQPLPPDSGRTGPRCAWCDANDAFWAALEAGDEALARRIRYRGWAHDRENWFKTVPYSEWSSAAPVERRGQYRAHFRYDCGAGVTKGGYHYRLTADSPPELWTLLELETGGRLPEGEDTMTNARRKMVDAATGLGSDFGSVPGEVPADRAGPQGRDSAGDRGVPQQDDGVAAYTCEHGRTFPPGKLCTCLDDEGWDWDIDELIDDDGA